jgi:cytochrome c oxidase subunit 4
MSKEAHSGPHEHEHYIVPLKNYVINAVALASLMGLTVIAATFDLGPFNPIVAIGIAITKAALIVLFFMNTWYNTRLTWVFVSLSFFWLLILFGMFLPDYLARDFNINPDAWQSSAYTVPDKDLPIDKQVVHNATPGEGGHGEH